MREGLSAMNASRSPRRRTSRLTTVGALLVALSLTGAGPSFGFEAETTLAGVIEQGTLRSQLHRRLKARFAHPLGVFEPLSLDLAGLRSPAKNARSTAELGPLAAAAVRENPQSGQRARSIYGRLTVLNPAEGYAPEWQQEEGKVYPLARLHAIGWLGAGAVLEHNPGLRVRHHFFNPQTGQGLVRKPQQSAESVTTASLQGGLSSFRDVMTGTAFDGTGLSAPDWLTSEENELGYPAFLRAYERAVLAPSEAERDSALAEALLCAGAMMSVLAQMADPAYVRGDLQAVLLGEGEARVAARFGRAAVPAPAQRDLTLPRRLRDLFADGEGGGLAEHTARTCQPAWHCYAQSAPAQLGEAARASARLLDYLFRSELRLTLKDGVLRVGVEDVAIGSGTLQLFAEGSDGIRRPLRSLPTPPTLTGGEVTQIALSPPELAGVVRLVVLYHGRDRANEPLLTSAQLVVGDAPASAATP